MNYTSLHKPTKLNLDKSRKSLLPDESFFLLNHDVNNTNALGKATPLAANEPACSMELPAGENYSPHNYLSELTNENYTWHYNSNGVHFISRINKNGECQIVYEGDCLIVSADPKHEIKQFRAILDVDYLCSKVPGGKLKRLVWVDGTDTPMGSIDVEASIATNSFTTPFFDVCGDPCAYIQNCVPEPSGCLVGEWVQPTVADRGLSNRMLGRGIKVAYRYIYYDQRASEVSDWSSLYYENTKGCFDIVDGSSRCLKFRIPIGNPMVEKIEFYVSENGGITWYLSDTIEKYAQYNTAQQYWFQRELAIDVLSTYDPTDCTFEYLFCNDKQKIAADPKLFTRITNPIPREVQGIFRIRDSIAAYNYVAGNCLIDKVEGDKFDVQLNCTDPLACTLATAKVTVRAIIYSDVMSDDAGFGGGGYIYRQNGTAGAVDDPTDTAWFGSGYFFLDQYFKSPRRNFIAYIEGTDQWGEMEQWRSSPNFTNTQKVGVLAGLSNASTRKWVKNDIISGNFYYQEYVFTVPKGMKGFIRLVSHLQDSGAAGNQNTSTQVRLMLGANGLLNYNGLTQSSDMTIDETVKEMWFDTCNGDWDDHNAFVVNDLSYGDETGYNGYITDNNGLPVAGALVYAGVTYRGITDFNGYYFFHDLRGTLFVNINAEQSCVGDFTQVGSFGATSDAPSHQMARSDFKIPSAVYASNFYADVNIGVRDCNNLPVRGIHIAMSGDKYKITDIDGIAHFNVRNYNTRDREITAVVMDNGNCFALDCAGNCNPCMPYTAPAVLLQPCFQGTPDYNITIPTQLDTTNIVGNVRGLKKGGRYAFAFSVEGDCGRVSAAYPLSRMNGYINIPKLQESGNLKSCSFTYSGAGMNLPSWGKKLKILRSANLNPFTLQWVVDSIERTTSGKIVLTIQSLNDYNKQFFFKTNTVYQFVQGDRVEFIKNGNGQLFDLATYGTLNYQILSPFNNEQLSNVLSTDDVNYFNQLLILDDGKLETLEKGAVIEIQPESIQVQQQTYFEICASIPLVPIPNTEYTTLGIPIGQFFTFDTFLVNRQIGTLPPQYFEHRSPSDFWGETTVDGLSSFISDIGKAHFLNPYENEKRYERNISINAANQMNYFGDFIKTLDATEQGYITAIAVKDDKIGLAICQNDNFLFEISDDLLRIGNDGLVRAAPVDSIISNPEPKIRGEYGCFYDDVGGIFFGDGFAVYPSAKSDAFILHNYQIAQMCGVSINQQTGLAETSCNTYFQKRMRQKAEFNRFATNVLDHLRWSVGQNKTNAVIYLTLKSLRHSGINNSKALYEQPNETIMYTAITDSFLGFASFTPEGYSQLRLNDIGGCSILMFQNSVAYITPVNPVKWNEFFGVSCDWVIGLTVNKYPDKVKIPLSLEMQSDKMFFASKVTTDKINFLSEVPPSRPKQLNGKWNFAFLNNVNSRGGLYEGDNARGYFTDVLLCRDNSVNLAYNTIDNQKREEYSEVDQIISKFELVEQSGYTENL